MWGKESNDELSDISSSSESSDNDSIPDIALLKPYDYEPWRTGFHEGLAALIGVYAEFLYLWKNIQKVCVLKKPTESHRNILKAKINFMNILLTLLLLQNLLL